MLNQSLKVIGAYCQNKNEFDLVKARAGKPIASYDFTKVQHKQLITALMTEWSIMIGLDEKLSPQESIINIKFLITQYSQMTMEEVRQAIMWSITNVLPIDPNPYGKFSAMYIAKILNAYLDKRDLILRRLDWDMHKDKWQKEFEEKNKPLPYDERVKSHREFLIRHMKDMKIKRVSDCAGSLVWKFLKRIGALNDGMITEEAKQYAVNKFSLYQQTEFYQKTISTMTKEQVDKKNEFESNFHERDYMIWKFLAKYNHLSDIDKLVNSIDSSKIIEK
jgi:hypothetical protein